MIRRTPITPLFDVELQRGAAPIGATPGTALVGVTIDKADTQDDPSILPIFNFDIHFSEPVTGFTAADVTVVASNGISIARSLTGSGADYTFSVKYSVSGFAPFDPTGTITASIPAGVATSVATGAPNEPSTSTDNTVSYASTFSQVASNILILTSRAYIDMAKLGDHLFISENNQGALLSVDVTTPAAPTITQTLDPITGGSSNATNPQGVDTDGVDRVFVSSIWQLRSMDVSNPAAMTTIGTTVDDSTNLNRAESCLYDNEMCYVGNIVTDRVTLVDVSATTPVVVGSIADALLVNPYVGAIVGDHLIVLAGNQVVSIDVSTPGSPVIADSLTTLDVNTGRRGGSITSVGNYVFALQNATFSVDSGLLVIDANDPTDLSSTFFELPILALNFLQNESFNAIARYGDDRIVLSGLTRSLVMFDVSDPTDPQLIAARPRILTDFAPSRIVTDPPYIYALFQNGGLHVYEYTGT